MAPKCLILVSGHFRNWNILEAWKCTIFCIFVLPWSQLYNLWELCAINWLVTSRIVRDLTLGNKKNSLHYTDLKTFLLLNRLTNHSSFQLKYREVNDCLQLVEFSKALSLHQHLHSKVLLLQLSVVFCFRISV